MQTFWRAHHLGKVLKLSLGLENVFQAQIEVDCFSSNAFRRKTCGTRNTRETCEVHHKQPWGKRSLGLAACHSGHYQSCQSADNLSGDRLTDQQQLLDPTVTSHTHLQSNRIVFFDGCNLMSCDLHTPGRVCVCVCFSDVEVGPDESKISSSAWRKKLSSKCKLIPTFH